MIAIKTRSPTTRIVFNTFVIFKVLCKWYAENMQYSYKILLCVSSPPLLFELSFSFTLLFTGHGFWWGKSCSSIFPHVCINFSNDQALQSESKTKKKRILLFENTVLTRIAEPEEYHCMIYFFLWWGFGSWLAMCGEGLALFIFCPCFVDIDQLQTDTKTIPILLFIKYRNWYILSIRLQKKHGQKMNFTINLICNAVCYSHLNSSLRVLKEL